MHYCTDCGESQFTSRLYRFLPLIGILIIALVTCIKLRIEATAVGQTSRPKYPRAAAPVFQSDEFSDIFMANIEQKIADSVPIWTDSKLQSGQFAVNEPKIQAAILSPQNQKPTGTQPVKGTWIRPETIEILVKESKLRLDKVITTPVRFSSGGAKDAQREFTLLTILFGIIDAYPEDVRWKSSAGLARGLFAQSARNSKIASTQSYNDAKQRMTDLSEILNGMKLTGTGSGATQEEQPPERAVIMRLMEWAYRDNMVNSSAVPKREANSNESSLTYAELLASLCVSLGATGMPDSEDRIYLEHIQSMLDELTRFQGAIKNENDTMIRESIGKIEQACGRCHDGYR